jgi:hypothetical protein
LLKKKKIRKDTAADLARQQAAALRDRAVPLASAASEKAQTAASSAKDWAAT